MEIVRGVIKKPLRVVVYGPEGIGKTTFASQFPASLFIDTENSSDSLDVARFPKPTSWTMLLEQVKVARGMIGEYRTLVIDTADWAEILCKSHVCAKANVTGIEDFGYGKGYIYLAEEFGKLLNMLSDLRDAGMNIVVTAHAAMRKFEQPDEMGSYDRWELKLEKKTAPLLKEWADMMLFANYETYIVKDGDGKNAKGKAQGGRRVMYATHHPCWDAKNRQGLPDKMPFDYQQIAHCIPNMGNPISPATEIPVTATATPEPASPVQESVPAMESNVPATPEADTKPSVAPPSDEQLPFTMNGRGQRLQDTIPKALQDLMSVAHVSEEDVRKVIVDKGYYPADTLWSVMESDGFVNGWIVPFWDKIIGMIKADPHWLPV